ncbi:tripartite tricarboxylate transporter TctB family protein [Chelatococcus sp. GCM10030263]|uniref:tripartite tricarboxylate transporter TctB family protein n=1 Tax=Chelatococcus sp. GCM10030263 TaxID=3273387 RepID=UPI0036156A33
MLRVADARKFWSGLLFAAIGAIALVALPRPIGSLISMGPGYFPMLLGSGLILIGLLSVGLSMTATEGDGIEIISLKPTLFIIGGIVAMAVLIEPAGLAASLLAMVLGTCHARLRQHPLEIAIIYLVVLALSWVVFIHFMQLPLKLFW